MTRPERFIQLLRDPSAPPPEGRHPADRHLLAIFVRMAYVDGRVGRAELDLLRRLRPGEDDNAVLGWVAELGNAPLELDALAEALPSRAEREDALLFLGWMAAEDERLSPAEQSLLAQVRRSLGV